MRRCGERSAKLGQGRNQFRPQNPKAARFGASAWKPEK